MTDQLIVISLITAMGDQRDFTDLNFVGNHVFNFDTEYNPKLNSPEEMDINGHQIINQKVSKHKDKKKKKTCKEGNWRNLLFDFAMSTSFHGPRLIVQPQPFCVRRTLWLLLFLAGTAIFLIQTFTSISRYRSYPVSVNVKINYNTSIAFPAVTICNGNAFRSTKAYEHDHYTLISEVFGAEGDKTNFSKYNSTPDLHHLYTTLGHSKADLIVSCFWYNRLCSSSDFVTTLTDFGKCYTFNSGKNDSHPVKKAYETGTKGGLRLQLNIEQYEYMLGPNAGAGLKVLIHNPDDIPLVRDHGLAIPPGSHGLIGIKTLEVRNLPPNYGICNDSVKLEYFEDYTIPNCYTNCKQRYLIQRCGCRDIYMPPGKDTPPFCNITSYHFCMHQAQDEFNNKVKEGCQQDCPVPCDSVLYEPMVSYASISNFDLESLLRGNSTDTLRKSYLDARETTQRVSQAVVKEDSSLIQSLNSIIQSLDIQFKQMQSQLYLSHQSLNTSFQDISQRVKFHMDRGLEAVKFIFKHDFIRGWDVFKERAFHYVTLDFMDFPHLLNTVVETAKGSDLLNDAGNRQLLFSPIQASIINKKRLIQRATEFMNETKIAYVTGDPLLTYKLTDDRRYDMSYISLPLLHTGIKEEELNYRTLIEGSNWMNSALDMLLEVGETFVNTGYFNKTCFTEGEELFLKGGKRYNYRIFMYESRIVYTPLEEINRRMDEFLRLNRTLYESQNDVELKISQIDRLLKNSVSHWQKITEVIQMSVTYLNDITQLKSPLSKAVTSKALGESIRLLSIFFQDIRSRTRELQDNMIDLLSSYKDVWRAMLEEESTKNFYHMLYNDSQAFLADNSTENYTFYLPIFSKLLRTTNSYLETLKPGYIVEMMNGDFHGINSDVFLKSLELQFMDLRKALDLPVHLGDLDALFISSFEDYHASMTMFVQGNNINTNFFQQNFMTLDVFMQELSYEEIQQQEAYDLAQMLSEIGGSMGLFIGGSVISIFEFLDVFVHNGARIAFNK